MSAAVSSAERQTTSSWEIIAGTGRIVSFGS
jgi:hypothetical protein